MTTERQFKKGEFFFLPMTDEARDSMGGNLHSALRKCMDCRIANLLWCLIYAADRGWEAVQCAIAEGIKDGTINVSSQKKMAETMKHFMENCWEQEAFTKEDARFSEEEGRFPRRPTPEEEQAVYKLHKERNLFYAICYGYGLLDLKEMEAALSFCFAAENC